VPFSLTTYVRKMIGLVHPQKVERSSSKGPSLCDDSRTAQVGVPIISITRREPDRRQLKLVRFDVGQHVGVLGAKLPDRFVLSLSCRMAQSPTVALKYGPCVKSALKAVRQWPGCETAAGIQILRENSALSCKQPFGLPIRSDATLWRPNTPNLEINQCNGERLQFLCTNPIGG